MNSRLAILAAVIAGAALAADNMYKCSDGPFACTDEVAYICGTDGVTYLNHCKFFTAYCSNNAINFAKEGKCDGSTDSDNDATGAGGKPSSAKKSSGQGSSTHPSNDKATYASGAGASKATYTSNGTSATTQGSMAVTPTGYADNATVPFKSEPQQASNKTNGNSAASASLVSCAVIVAASVLFL
ncbi:Kazal-like domain-containing protein [Plasmodiophora brassicae]|uniref:Kazal-like domain-containing protein n=1 Tax=Plasmodiophora brassicae TaxID=37360 RepID=A0A0G4IGY5_PLABS|nr:hypothetical protein PBRA_000229 [Plasmodiophora brassicae]SPQ96790.1 unnamed protein product [Plasmodiophora brassicae]